MEQKNILTCFLLSPFLNLLRWFSQTFAAAPEEDQLDHLNITISTR